MAGADRGEVSPAGLQPAPQEGDHTDTAEDEFNTLAGWTAEVLVGLPRSRAVPGACRGSGNPAALAWLAEALELGRDTAVLDTGGGLGGPAAWLVERYGSRPVICEPMQAAAGWARRLFGLPVVAASADGIPLRAGTFDAAWALGVLSTIEDKAGFLAEVRRVLSPAGRFGLLEYVMTGPEIPDPPAGNRFFTAEQVNELLNDHGFVIINTVGGEHLPPVPLAWQARVEQVKEAVAAAHPSSAVIGRATAQEERFRQLLSSGLLDQFLVHAVVAD